MLSLQFIGGYFSALGSFLEYKRGRNLYYGFQLKTTKENYHLLELIKSTLEITNKVYLSKSQPGYSLLIIRDRNTIIQTLIPIFNEYLVGHKQEQYLLWKQRFLSNCSTWNYRKVTSKIEKNIPVVDLTENVDNMGKNV